MDVVFYRVLLPLLAACNLGLGLMTLGGLGQRGPGWITAVELGTGAVCCGIGGGLVATSLNRSYWSRAMRRQVGVWRAVTDAFVRWLEESPPSDESLERLHHALQTILDEDQLQTPEAQIPSGS